MQWSDAIGKQHARCADTPRIVSLVPSLTELLVDLGLAEYLVGRTGFCIHPRQIFRRLPKVGGTKGFSIDKLRALAPTHVLVNIDAVSYTHLDVYKRQPSPLPHCTGSAP